MKVEEMKQSVKIVEGAEVKVENNIVTAKGSKGELTRNLPHAKIIIRVADGQIMLVAKNATKREKTMMGTYMAHIKNMMKGVTEGHEHKLKVCSGHFPMTVTVKDKEVEVKNYLGEKIPRITKFPDGVDVKVEGDVIVVNGPDIEKVGMTASAIELSTKRVGFDRRIFQDGIYIISKNGKEI